MGQEARAFQKRPPRLVVAKRGPRRLTTEVDVVRNGDAAAEHVYD